MTRASFLLENTTLDSCRHPEPKEAPGAAEGCHLVTGDNLGDSLKSEDGGEIPILCDQGDLDAWRDYLTMSHPEGWYQIVAAGCLSDWDRRRWESDEMSGLAWRWWGRRTGPPPARMVGAMREYVRRMRQWG